MPEFPLIFVFFLYVAVGVMIVVAPVFIWHHCAGLHKLAKAAAEREARMLSAQARAAEAMAEVVAELERLRALVAQVALNQERYAQIATEEGGHISGFNEAVPVEGMVAKKSSTNRAPAFSKKS